MNSSWISSIKNISIHALLAESDFTPLFLTTQNTKISIHALLAESDCYSLRHSASSWHFYPRSPCGERPWQRGSRITYVEISIHALLAESDSLAPKPKTNATEFLSTLSLRRATSRPRALKSRRMVFLSTLSLRRATCLCIL